MEWKELFNFRKLIVFSRDILVSKNGENERKDKGGLAMQMDKESRDSELTEYLRKKCSIYIEPFGKHT